MAIHIIFVSKLHKYCKHFQFVVFIIKIDLQIEYCLKTL